MNMPRHIIQNPRERYISTDDNDRQYLQHAALLALGAAVLQGDSAVYGVVQGGIVSANGADLNVSISPILALRSGTALSDFHSAIQWIQSFTAHSLSLSTLVSGTNPRWVVIEVVEGYEPEAQQVRQIFNSANGSFTAAPVDKTIRPAPTFSARAGTAAANPVFPSGTAGVIPLAYVYLAAGALAINATDIVMCRPMLRGDGGADHVSVRDVWGGGVAVSAAGTTVLLRNAGGRFSGSRVRWGLGATDGTSSFMVTAPGYDGAAAPVVDDVVYFYAAPPPYPAGYDANLAPREHRPGATALTRYQGMVCPDLHNAVIVTSTVEPQIDTPMGCPAAGDFAIQCAPFSAVGSPVNIDRTTVAYLGATSWDVSATQHLAQSLLGNVVTPTNETSTAVSGAAAYNIWGVGGSLMLFPIAARHVHTQVDLDDNDTNDGTGVAVSVTDGTGVTWRWALPRATVIGSLSTTFFMVFTVSTTGTVTVSTVTVEPFDNVTFRGVAYVDAILGQR